MDYFEHKKIKILQIKEHFSSLLAAKNNLDQGVGPERELLPEITFCLKDLTDGRVNAWLGNIFFCCLPIKCPFPFEALRPYLIP